MLILTTGFGFSKNRDIRGVRVLSKFLYITSSEMYCVTFDFEKVLHEEMLKVGEKNYILPHL